MDLGIIGGGNIGGPLARLWAAAGHRVRIGSRTPGKIAPLVETIHAAGGDAQAVGVDEAAKFGEVVLEAIPFAALPSLPVRGLVGKPLLSAANYYPHRDGPIELGGLGQSEWAARQLPGVLLVKAFNMMRAGVIEALADGRGTPGLAILLAGDDAGSKRLAEELVRDARFEPVDVGPLSAGRLFQSPDAPLYDVRMSARDVRARLAGLN